MDRGCRHGQIPSPSRSGNDHATPGRSGAPCPLCCLTRSLFATQVKPPLPAVNVTIISTPDMFPAVPTTSASYQRPQVTSFPGPSNKGPLPYPTQRPPPTSCSSVAPPSSSSSL